MAIGRLLTKQYGEQYRWMIVVGGILGLFGALGLSRFSLGMMLPAMGQGLGLSYSHMGLISTINFCGYLGAVLFCGAMVQRFGSRSLIGAALLLAGVSMVLIGVSSSYSLILLLYALTGIGSAWANIPIIGVIAAWFSGSSRGRAAGLCVMGNGFGFVVCGYFLPLLNCRPDGWRLSWLALGTVISILALLCFIILRNRPVVGAQIAGDEQPGQEKSAGQLQEQTCGKETKATAGNTRRIHRHHAAALEDAPQLSRRILWHCGMIYFLYGFTYVIYVTFFVTSLVQDRGLTEQAAGLLWSRLGWISLISGPLFGYLSDKFGRKVILAAVLLIQAASYGLLAAPGNLTQVYLSFCFFGVTAWSVPTIIAALMGDYAGPEKTAAMFGVVTFFFGVGQITGPALTGFLAERAGSFASSFFIAAVLAGLAALLSLLLPSLKRAAG